MERDDYKTCQVLTKLLKDNDNSLRQLEERTKTLKIRRKVLKSSLNDTIARNLR